MLVNLGMPATEYAQNWTNPQNGQEYPVFELAKRETLILKRAERKGWSRDLSAKIHAKADALVRKHEVRSEVRSETDVSERWVVGAIRNAGQHNPYRPLAMTMRNLPI